MWMNIFLNRYVKYTFINCITIFYISFQHNMKEYVSLINRSHLEKSPDKYVVPGAEEVTRSVTELAVLKPNVTGLDIHEYPNEHVLVLKGQNLWFTYKIYFDEKGEKHEICTPSESTTKTMVEFRINHVHKVHSTLCSGRKVKITHFTHFAKPMNRMLDIKKVKSSYFHVCLLYRHNFSPAGISCFLC